MRLSSLLSLGLIAAGAAASIKTLRRRHQWECANQRTCIVLDYDDALAVCARAGIPLAEFLPLARAHGAAHISLPELTLDRLMRQGRLAPVIPSKPIAEPPPVGNWIYLAGAEPELLAHLAAELRARLPSSNAHLISNLQPPTSDLRPLTSDRQPPTSHLPPPTLALSGHLPTLAEMGLGFETSAAAEILLAGLGLVPRPVSFAWPEDHLVERTLAQVAGLGAQIVAFDGDLILGHEMHLEATVRCLERFGLHFAYFCETRHQKGDWFVAKHLAPRGQVVLAHYFTPAAMVPEDFHSAAHHWGMLAHARGIRLCYINVFRRIHAAEPLECLKYLDHVRKNLDAYDGVTSPPVLASPARKSLALTGLAPAGAVAMAASETLGLPEPLALGLAVASAAGAAALPYLDRPRGRLEESYPPSYAPKLLALAGASAAPLAATRSRNLLSAMFVQAGMAASLAALTAGQEYQQRVEEYRSLNADLFLPLAGIFLRELADPKWKFAALAALGLGWYGIQRFSPDVLGAIDRDLPAGHTHHLSAAQRFVGDALMALGPRPGRKWAGLGLAGLAAARAFHRMSHSRAALAASLVSVLGNALMLAAFRKPERPLAETLPAVAKSWAWGGVMGLIIRRGKGGR
jgi:hypothetical protein